LGKIERFDKQTRVAELAAVGAAHEAPQLCLASLASPRRLLLEGAEGSKVALRVKDGFDAGRAESADQLVLQVVDTNVETQPFHIGASEVAAEAGPFETAPEYFLLAGVAKTSESRVRAMGTEPNQEALYRLRTSDRHDGNALAVEVATTARSEGLERDLVAESFHEHDRA
jgi:hypothetical protein